MTQQRQQGRGHERAAAAERDAIDEQTRGEEREDASEECPTTGQRFARQQVDQGRNARGREQPRQAQREELRNPGPRRAPGEDEPAQPSGAMRKHRERPRRAQLLRDVVPRERREPPLVRRLDQTPVARGGFEARGLAVDHRETGACHRQDHRGEHERRERKRAVGVPTIERAEQEARQGHASRPRSYHDVWTARRTPRSGPMVRHRA